MNYTKWAAKVPTEITNDRLWSVEAYRLALFAGEIGWHDATKLMRDKRTLDLSDQLYRALGSISANLAEGYSRRTGRDRARFYEYALGSAREARDWYYKARHVLGEEIATHRLNLLTQVIRLLLTMVPEERGRVLHEDSPDYHLTPDGYQPTDDTESKELPALLENIPLP